MRVKTKTRETTGRRSLGKAGKKREGHPGIRRRVCRFCMEKVKTIDYKDLKRLESLLNERGKILSPRFSGNCAKHQRRLVEAVKKARFISLVPYLRS